MLLPAHSFYTSLFSFVNTFFQILDLLISDELKGMIQIKRNMAIVGCGKYLYKICFAVPPFIPLFYLYIFIIYSFFYTLFLNFLSKFPIFPTFWTYSVKLFEIYL
jgi:hypothetical protein